jgi:hypothetical protein
MSSSSVDKNCRHWKKQWLQSLAQNGRAAAARQATAGGGDVTHVVVVFPEELAMEVYEYLGMWHERFEQKFDEPVSQEENGI